MNTKTQLIYEGSGVATALGHPVGWNFNIGSFTVKKDNLDIAFTITPFFFRRAYPDDAEWDESTGWGKPIGVEPYISFSKCNLEGVQFLYEVEILGCTVRVGWFDVYPTTSTMTSMESWNWDESMVDAFNTVKPGQTTPSYSTCLLKV